jgi:hypothetical protein
MARGSVFAVNRMLRLLRKNSTQKCDETFVIGTLGLITGASQDLACFPARNLYPDARCRQTLVCWSLKFLKTFDGLRVKDCQLPCADTKAGYGTYNERALYSARITGERKP